MTILDKYSHAMHIDPETGKVMSKVLAEVSGNSLVEQKTQVDSVTGTLTFSDVIYYVDIYNRDLTNDGVFNVNGINITVPKGEAVSFKVSGTPRETVTVTGAILYIVSRLV